MLYNDGLREYIEPRAKAKCNTGSAKVTTLSAPFSLLSYSLCDNPPGGTCKRMASSRKKVIVRTVSDGVLSGYLPPTGVLGVTGAVALLDLEARMIDVPLAGIRWIAYVRDFNLADTIDPERLTRRTFLARPRTEGLWVRLTLAGGDVLEGLAPIDAALMDNLMEDGGLFLTPPDIRSNTQRLFVPRRAITELQVLAVVTNPSKVKPLKPETAAKPVPAQNGLFE